MNIWRKKYILGLSKDLLVLAGLVFIKVAEMILFTKILNYYFGIQVTLSEEVIDVVVLIMILTPFIFIVLRQKNSMREAENKYRVLAEDSLIAIYTISDKKITYANHQFSVLTGYAHHELVGMNVFELVYPDDRSLVIEEINRKLNGDEQSSRFEFRAVRKDRSIINVEIYGTVMTQDGKPQIVGSVLDITERKKTENVLIDMAYKDPLTGLPNRRFLEENFIVKNRQMAALIFFDLDGFKAVNDSFGHEMGDLLLKEVADRLLSCTRADDILSRMGGDEFIIFLNEIDKEGALKAAQRIIDDITQPFYIRSKEIHLTTSIGISFYPDNGKDIETLLRNADLAMYQAKSNGKNGVSISAS